MELYYGISLVMIVATICIGIGARIFYRGVLSEIDNYKDKRARKMARVVAESMNEIVAKLKPVIDEAIEKEKKAKEEMYKYRKEIYGEKD